MDSAAGCGEELNRSSVDRGSLQSICLRSVVAQIEEDHISLIGLPEELAGMLLGSTFCGENRVSAGSQLGQHAVFSGAYE